MARLSLRKGRYAARLAEGAADILAAQQLRTLTFRGPGAALDADAFDGVCQHVLVEETRSGRLVCCFRLLPLQGGAEIEHSYSAQYYELSGLHGFDGPLVEMGRFCIHPDVKDPDILRVAWGAMTQFVDEQQVELLFGCSSFQGTEAEDYMDAFALLKDRHLAPKRFLPRIKAPNVFKFAQKLRRKKPRRQTCPDRHAADAAHLSDDGWLGQRSRGGGPRPEHVACVHRAGNQRHPTRPQTSAARHRRVISFDLSRPRPRCFGARGVVPAPGDVGWGIGLRIF